MSSRLKEVLAHLGLSPDDADSPTITSGRGSGGTSGSHSAKKGKKEGHGHHGGGGGSLARTASGTHMPPGAAAAAGPRYTAHAAAPSLPPRKIPHPAPSGSSTGSSNFAGALLSGLPGSGPAHSAPAGASGSGGRGSDGSVSSEFPALATHKSFRSSSGGGGTAYPAAGSAGSGSAASSQEGRQLADQMAAAREFRDREREEETALLAAIESIRAASSMQAPSFHETVRAHKAAGGGGGGNANSNASQLQGSGGAGGAQGSGDERDREAPVHFHTSSGRIQWIQPSGPRRSGEGVEDEMQGVLRVDRTPSGGAMLRVTLLAAGFLIGPSGCSIRTIGKETGADIKSWSEKSGPLCPRPSRCFIVEGRKKAVCRALEIIRDAVARYVELTEGPAAGSLVQRCQPIRGIHFFYM